MQMQVQGLLLVDRFRQLGFFNTGGQHWSLICLERWLNWQKHLAGNEMGLKPHARSERVLSANLMPGRPIGRTLPLEGSSCQFEPGTGNQRRFHWRVAQSVVRSALTRKVGGSYPPSPAICRISCRVKQTSTSDSRGWLLYYNPRHHFNDSTEGLQEGRVRAESTTSSIGRVALRRDAASESPTASVFPDGRFS